MKTAARILPLLEAPLLQTFSLLMFDDESVPRWKGFSDLDNCLATARFANIHVIVELLALEDKQDPLMERSKKVHEQLPRASERGVLEVKDLDDPIFLRSPDSE